MKAYTDIEQSKKLAEILPVENADMRYSPLGDNLHPWILTDTFLEKDAVPCWSLAALLDVLPILNNRTPVIPKTFDGKYRVVYHSTACERGIFTHDYDNPVDACVEMIIKLHEQNIL